MSHDKKKKEMSSKMYSNHRCGKCNRFGHSHENCQKGLEKTLDKFNADNKGAGKQTSHMSSHGSVDLESRSKKAGFYVNGHKNFGDVYED